MVQDQHLALLDIYSGGTRRGTPRITRGSRESIKVLTNIAHVIPPKELASDRNTNTPHPEVPIEIVPINDNSSAKIPRHFPRDIKSSSTPVNTKAVAKEIITKSVIPSPYTILVLILPGLQKTH